MVSAGTVSISGKQLEETSVHDFIARIGGPVVRPGDSDYDEVRKVMNGLIDRRPALIVRCSGAADVIEAVNFARQNQLLVSVRGGGHNAAGSAICDGGIVIDLSLMNGVRVDPRARTVRAAGGATWADVDRETQVFGLATCGGNMSTTGIGGLTLHGGMGHLRRKYGLSIDNLVSVDVVTADGQLRTASATENEDLFWAIRGAGSNFGVVTSFEFRLHPVGPLVYFCGPVYPAEDAGRLLRLWRDYLATAPDEVSSVAVFWTIPNTPMFPEAVHGRQVLLLPAVYSDAIEDGERICRPLREFGPTLLDMSQPMPYTIVQSAFDPFFYKGVLFYWKSLWMESLSDEAIEKIVQYAEERPSPMSMVGIWHHGGAVHSVEPTETAFAQRSAPYLLSFDTTWDDPALNESAIAWTREAWTSMLRFAPGGEVYLNFLGFGEDQASLLRASYGPNYERLVALKNKYDPTNLFRMNQNLKPTVQPPA